MEKKLYQNKYWVYEDGSVHRVDKRKLLKPSYVRHYWYYNLNNDKNKMTSKNVAKLVAECFLDKPTNNHQYIIYKDGNIDNYHVNNLKWVTYEEYLQNRQQRILNNVDDNKHRKLYSNTYWVYDDGRIENVIRRQFLNPNPNQFGYLVVSLHINKKMERIPVHQLVAKFFLPKVEGKNYINHIDENKENNNVTNLEWVTTQENLAAYWEYRVGKKHYRSHLTTFEYKNNIYTLDELLTYLQSNKIIKIVR